MDRRKQILKLFWTVGLLFLGVVLTAFAFTKNYSLGISYSNNLAFLPVMVAMAFVAEYVDSSLGMGYGTTLTPILIILGFSPLQVVPAVLFSEFISGISAGSLHHKLGNVNLGRGTRAHKTMCILALCSIIGTVISVLLALSLPKHIIKFYIGIMICLIGLFILIGRYIGTTFSWKKIIGLGTLAAFNKGISGGGYGPLVTGGQIIVGVSEKNAIGITSFAEGLVCLMGLILYVSFNGWFAWSLALPLTIGAILSVPAATWTVKILPERLLRQSIGYATLFLGALTLTKVMI